jgi:predicted nuclease of predicted toxin-antitoxin system
MPTEWEIWIDVHISPAIAKWMKEFTGEEVKSAYALSIHNMIDLEVYRLARSHGNVILLSKDSDFPELISKLGAPPKLITIRKGNCNNKTLWEFLKPSIKNAIQILKTTNTEFVEIE